MKSKSYSEEQILKSAKEAIRVIVASKKIIARHKKELISYMCWKITEVSGKYRNQRYVSEDVKRIGVSVLIKNRLLRHEHVFTRHYLTEQIIKNPKHLDKILKNCIACLVTREEHRRLEDYKIGWRRYEVAKIRVYDTKLKSWKIK